MRAKVRAVIPAEAGIQGIPELWIPASAGMTKCSRQRAARYAREGQGGHEREG